MIRIYSLPEIALSIIRDKNKKSNSQNRIRFVFFSQGFVSVLRYEKRRCVLRSGAASVGEWWELVVGLKMLC